MEDPAQLGKSDHYHCSMLMIFRAYSPGGIIIDQPMPTETVWGPQRAVYIAKNHPELAIKSADNYEWYANVCRPTFEPVNSYFPYRGACWLAPRLHVSSADVTRNCRKFTGRRNAGRHIGILAANGKLYAGAEEHQGIYVEEFPSSGLSFRSDKGGILRDAKACGLVATLVQSLWLG